MSILKSKSNLLCFEKWLTIFSFYKLTHDIIKNFFWSNTFLNKKYNVEPRTRSSRCSRT